MRRQAWAGALLATAVLAAAGCSGAASNTTGEEAKASGDPAKVSGEIKVLTHRTDLEQNGTLKKYAAEFNKIYPKVKVTFEALTDYEGEVKIRMNTENYGDVLMIPGVINKADYPKFFAPLGDAAEFEKKYRFVDKTTVKGKAYGVATFGAANGFVYNKKVWEQAGITEWPTTTDEFLADLKTIKAKTDSTPYYTNFKDGWPLTSWTNVNGTVSCDGTAGDKMVDMANPWAEGNDLNVIDTLLYDIVDNKLSEKDPSTTNWENSKGLIAKGEIASMQLGSWAISQMRAAAKDAGVDPETIGYMPFPAQTDGKHCSTLVSDYQQAVNAHSKSKAAARAWIDWFTDKSGHAETEQAVSTLKDKPMPPSLKSFVDAEVTFVEYSEAKTEQVNAIDSASEVGLRTPDYRKNLIDVARGAKDGDLQSVFADLGKRWDEARKSVDAGS